ncbi:hypothetical protein DYQ86_14955 [Acidobacteria bacterium AB60]|nr:hypothetical protein DYQ86_14955 [Acidobacteria bacterium AB60]
MELRPFCPLAVLLLAAGMAGAQASGNATASPQALQEQVEKLAAILSQEESALRESQLRIEQLRRQVTALEAEMAGQKTTAPAEAPQREAGEGAARLEAEVSALREQQDLQQSEIATHDQIKVESASRFPVKLTGLILMNGFYNSRAVDVVQEPTVALPGGGATGFSLWQSIVGLDARGPHVLGAASSGDVRADFFGSAAQSSYTSGGSARLRTAHAELAWNAARAYVALDRSIVNPNAPTSLTALGEPALAWSGNLWNWIPQIGGEITVPAAASSRFTMEAALADVPNPPPLNSSVVLTPSASLAERSRRPGTEARMGYSQGDKLTGWRFGVGGYYSPHQGPDYRFDAWAATADYRIPITSRLELSGNAYRGAALGGLGGGGFKDYIWRRADDTYHALDDVGGWGQLKGRVSERLELNAAFGLDNAFADQVRPYAPVGSGWYQNLARNATFTSNAIFSPTAYTLFSFEYRRIDSSSASGANWKADVYGVAAGYRF